VPPVHWNAKRTWVDVTDNQFPRLSAFEKLRGSTRVGDAYLQIENLMVASSFMERVL